MEGFHELQPLRQLFDLGFRIGLRDFLPQHVDLFFEIKLHEQIKYGLSPHLGGEIIAVLLKRFVILLVAEELADFQIRGAIVNHHEGFEVKHPLDVPERHIQQQANARRQRLQKPDMGHGAGQLNVAHALPAHLGERDLNATLLTNHTPVLKTLVLSAKALVILNGPKNAGAEKAIALGLKGPVVDGLGLLHLAKGPGTDHLRRRETNAQGIEVIGLGLRLQQIQ